MADATTNRLVREMDSHKTVVNALTSLTPQSAKIPIAFDTDREAIERMLLSLPLADTLDARIVRIADTLSVAEMEISASLWRVVQHGDNMFALSELNAFHFDGEGNLDL